MCQKIRKELCCDFRASQLVRLNNLKILYSVNKYYFILHMFKMHMYNGILLKIKPK